MPDPGAAPRRASGGAVTVAIPRASRWRDLWDGLLHVATAPALLAMMLLAFLVNLTAYPISSGLMPYIAQRVYHVDATGLGWLLASFSFGGLLASLTTVLTDGPRGARRATLVHTALWYACLLGFGHAPSLGLGLLALLAAGFVQNVAMISMTAALLAASGEGFRGRVMGVRMLAVYGMLPGLLGSGALVEHLGYSQTVTVLCAIGLVFTVLIGVRWRANLWWPQRAGATSVAQSV